MNTSLSDCTSNYIYLTANEDYVHGLAKLCERCALSDNNVLLITNRKGTSSCGSKSLKILQVPDIESTPQRLLDLQGSSDGRPDNDISAPPDLVVFDLYSLIVEAIQRPVMQQCSIDQMVRHIAKCAAAFANYRELVANMELGGPRKSVDTVVVMSQDSYPMTPAQFKLLIGLYFYGNECHTNFWKLAGKISVSQGCEKA